MIRSSIIVLRNERNAQCKIEINSNRFPKWDLRIFNGLITKLFKK